MDVWRQRRSVKYTIKAAKKPPFLQGVLRICDDILLDFGRPTEKLAAMRHGAGIVAYKRLGTFSLDRMLRLTFVGSRAKIYSAYSA